MILREGVPAGGFTVFNGLEQIARLVVRVLSQHFLGFLVGCVLEALIRVEVNLKVFERGVLNWFVLPGDLV